MSGLKDAQVLVVDDHPALRKGVEVMLRGEGVHIAGSASSAEQGLELARRRRPELVVVDLDLPEHDGAWLVRELLADRPDLGAVIYTGVDDQKLLTGALDCGARGFALKTGSPEGLLEALRTVAAGGTWVDPLLNGVILARETTEKIHVLTPREREMLDWLAKGLNGEEIAQRLFLSWETVRTHIRNAMRKLNANTRTHAIVIALRQGEIDFEESPV